MSFRALCLVAALLWPGVLLGQQADVLTGRITDPDGQPVVGARVAATSVDTELTRSVLTGRDGRYMILFPDGGGVYLLRVTYLGMADVVRPVVREAAEEILLADVRLERQAISLDELVVNVDATTAAGETGQESVGLSQELLSRLPLPDYDPETIALLAPGVIGTEMDSLTDRMRFSVAGMREELNQITLDGVALDDEVPLGVPEEGLRRVEVTTNTFDASQGGFAGGQVSMQSARGNNRSSGSLTYRLDNDGLQLRAVPVANPFTRHNLGGSWGGALVQDLLFYNVSFQFSRNETQRFALASDDPLAAQRSGVSVDSIARFLSILDGYGAFPQDRQTGRYRQLSDDWRLQARLDWNIMQSDAQSHTLSARINTNFNVQDSTRISTLDLMQHGGETGRNTRQATLNLTSRFGRNWTHRFDLSYQDSWSDALPYTELPEGQVRVTSEFEDGTRGSRSLIFGGNRNMPTESKSRTFRISNELSFMLPLGDQVHRLKVGGSFDTSESLNRSTSNLFGSFRYASLEDLEANRPYRYERTLTERETESGRASAGFFLSDTWRISQPLELTLGLRYDYSRLQQRPEYNPAIEELFGRRTDITPASGAWSPRLGFSYTLPQRGGGGRSSLTGGIGYFAGRAPTSIFSTAVRQTGLPNAELLLQCIDEAVPVPDWRLYREDPSQIPLECAGDVSGVTTPQSSRAPTVTTIDPDQPLPGSIRLDLGYRTRLPFDISGNFRYQYSLGRNLWGYRDLNLDPSTATTLGDGRLFFGDPADIGTFRGTVSMVGSRRYPQFAHVYEVVSGLSSVSHQLTAQLSGTLPPRIRTNVNYTLSFTRDQGSGSLSRVTTAGDPHEIEWAVADNDRRHNINISLTYALTESIEISANGRLQSGQPFTPLVNRDINGDGLRNDRAFVPDPRAVGDTAMANAMDRLLGNVSGRVRDCLESQFGRIAERNSCRGSWTQSLNMAVNFRPMLPGLQRRMTITANLRNVLTGLDYLFHGPNAMRGWGEGQRMDQTLLEVAGFDPTQNLFRYEVNEGFGQDNRGPEAFRNSFSMTLSARVSLGGNPSNASRGFNTGGGGNRGGGGGNRGGGGGRGGQGGGGRPSFQLPELVALLRAQPAGDPDIDSVVDALLVNGPARVLALRDSLELELDEEQTAAVQALADSLANTLADGRDSLQIEIARLAPYVVADGGEGDLLGPQPQEIQQQFRERVQPRVERARQENGNVMRAVRQRLTEAQWEQLPQELRRMAQGGSGGGRQSFDPVATLDRMLANPLLVLLELRDVVGMTPEQATAIRAVADSLQLQLNERRSALGRRFDNLPPEEQARVFQEIQPLLDEGRAEIRAALDAAQAILTPQQWEQVPRAVREPFGPREGS